MEAKFSRLKGTLEQKLLLCKTTDQVREMIEGYIKNHEEKDACLSLGGLTPNQFEKYILTGVYPLDSYYGIDAKELHPIDGLIKKLKEIAHQRTERAKKEKADHEERMKLIMELQNVDPAAVIERDRVIALQEKVRCMKAKHACDVDIKLWEVMNERIARAVSFIRQASPEVLERLKERRNWSDYPELQYFKDFPQHRNGKIMLFDRDEMGPELAGPVSLWVAVDGFIAEVIDFFDKASEETRKLLEDPANWDSFPELSFLKNMKSGEDKKAV